MPILKNGRDERFAQLVAAGKSYTDAYGEAGFKPNRHNAAHKAKEPDVAARIEELLGKGAAKAEVTIASLITEAGDIQTKAMTAAQFSAAVAALTAKAKLAGHWVEKRENTNRTVDANRLSDDELAAHIEGDSGDDPAEAEDDPA